MGCGSSKSTTVMEPSRTVEYSKSLQSNGDKFTSPKERFARRTSAHRGVMSSVAMKFPHIRRSFVACEGVFKRHAVSKSAHVSRHDLLSKEIQLPYIRKHQCKQVLIELGADAELLTEKKMHEILSTSNLDGDDKIDFKEFLIAAAIGCFLATDPDGQNAEFLSIRKGFEAVQSAFCKIDKDGSGQIDYDELREAFLAMKDDDLIDQRLAELDFNGDKDIEFPEFVWGLSAWVGIFDMDEEDDDDDYINNVSKITNTSSIKIDDPYDE